MKHISLTVAASGNKFVVNIDEIRLIENPPVGQPGGALVYLAVQTVEGAKVVLTRETVADLCMLTGASSQPATPSELLLAQKRANDPHTKYAAELFKVGIADVTPEQRAMAKTMRFGEMYGVGTDAIWRTMFCHGKQTEQETEARQKVLSRKPNAKVQPAPHGGYVVMDYPFPGHGLSLGCGATPAEAWLKAHNRLSATAFATDISRAKPGPNLQTKPKGTKARRSKVVKKAVKKARR